jgi:hypothetical protein
MVGCVAGEGHLDDGNWDTRAVYAQLLAGAIAQHARNEMHALGIELFLYQQALDTTTPAGKAMFQMLGVFSEFERAMIVERVRSGLAKAKAKGTGARAKPSDGRASLSTSARRCARPRQRAASACAHWPSAFTCRSARCRRRCGRQPTRRRRVPVDQAVQRARRLPARDRGVRPEGSVHQPGLLMHPFCRWIMFLRHDQSLRFPSLSEGSALGRR